MTDNNPDVDKGIGCIGQPDDPDLSGLEYLMYPPENGRRTAIVVFKNGARLQFKADSDGQIHQETFFASGHEHESREVDGEGSPSEHMNHLLREYHTISKSDLRTSRPALWTIVEDT